MPGGNKNGHCFLHEHFHKFTQTGVSNSYVFLHFALKSLGLQAHAMPYTTRSFEILQLLNDQLSLIQSSYSSSVTQETSLLETKGKRLKIDNLSTLNVFKT